MYYKFVGGGPETLYAVFDKAVVGGSLKFNSASSFNDPYEFKFVSRAPTRPEFDAWHAMYDSSRSATELSHAWEAFSGPAAHWNTTVVPRMNLLESFYVLCLAKRWDSHLMWAHYTSAHQGFAIRYRPEIVDALRSLDGFESDSDVAYSDAVPELRWFNSHPAEARLILFTKSREWRYEEEYRVVLHGDARQAAIFRSVSSSFIDGVIFGTRAPTALIEAALTLQETRPEFQVEQVTSKASGYEMATNALSPNVWPMSGIL
ncbi:DUF2971 domain-containing protein [Rhizobium leguminosarum]|uniref:DUF2971 domain-containing protein n=1 Tax=Rhizobium leguminosarum TaxID=384 RepID=UPI000518F8E7|nr:DUF2971 domain-containing protein [Rhizobium leguminosarum]